MLTFSARILLIASAMCVTQDLPAQSCGVPLVRIRHTLDETEWQGLGCPTCLVQHHFRETGPASEAAELSLEGGPLTRRYASRVVGSANARASAFEGQLQIEHEFQHVNTYQGGVDIHDFSLATEVDLFVPGTGGTEYAVALEFQSDPILPQYYGRGLSYEVSTSSGVRVSALGTGWSGIARGRTSGSIFYRNGTAYSYATTLRVAGGASAGYSCILFCTYTPWNTVGQSLKLKARVLGLNPDIEVMPEELDFGKVIWRQSKELPLVLRNNGLSTLAGTIAQPVPNAQFQILGETDFRLGPHEEHRLRIKFTAAAPFVPWGSALHEETSTKFQIHSNDPCEPLITVTANAVREAWRPRLKRCEVLPYQNDWRLISRIVFESTSGNINDLWPAFPGFPLVEIQERLWVVGSSAHPYYAPSPPFNESVPNKQAGTAQYIGRLPDGANRNQNEAWFDDGHGPNGKAPHYVLPLRNDFYELRQQYEYRFIGATDWMPVGPEFIIRREILRRNGQWYYTIRKTGCSGEMAVRIP